MNLLNASLVLLDICVSVTTVAFVYNFAEDSVFAYRFRQHLLREAIEKAKPECFSADEVHWIYEYEDNLKRELGLEDTSNNG